ncbi:MAG: Clp protease ClpP, partial [Clostridiales bacterium]|nr:Clp protease ClpP [Clostridiales bacterium]
NLFGKKSNKINIKRDCYTMATVNGNSAEITMYGEIVEQRPVDWWTEEPIDGDYIVENEFIEDLKTVESAKTITIRMNSVGGDAGVAILIHNRLRELAAKGKTLICIVDGIAMSGGSLIMCACDTVRVNPSSIVMIHKCLRLVLGYYNSDELRQIAESNDAWDKAQVSIYTRKSKLSETVIKHMMSDTTYMSGKEAVEKGFADELLDDAEPLDIAASADRSTLFVNGRAIRLPLSKLPESIQIPVKPDEDPSVKTNKNLPAETGSEGGKNLMAKNLEELRKENPELAATIEAEVKAAASANAATTSTPAATTSTSATSQPNFEDILAAERRRIQEIDEIAAMINDAEIVREAKYGDKPCTAQELAFRAMQKQAKQGEQSLANTAKDYQASNAAKVGAAPTGGDENPNAKLEEAVDAGVEAAKKAFGR